MEESANPRVGTSKPQTYRLLKGVQKMSNAHVQLLRVRAKWVSSETSRTNASPVLIANSSAPQLLSMDFDLSQLYKVLHLGVCSVNYQ